MKYYRNLLIVATCDVFARMQRLPMSVRIAGTAALRLDMGGEDIKAAEDKLSRVKRRVAARAKTDAANLRKTIASATSVDPEVTAILDRLEKSSN
jgi:hypothetical protein